MLRSCGEMRVRSHRHAIWVVKNVTWAKESAREADNAVNTVRLMGERATIRAQCARHNSVLTNVNFFLLLDFRSGAAHIDHE